jgi:low temperature requirement protein LtrA
MTEHGIRIAARRRMTGRGDEAHRVASPLELFFDLAFVVAVAFAARNLHHDIGAQHVVDGLLHFATGFFAIWWAWMNFTWFASAYDTDDVPFRLLTMVQMIGVVVMAIGIAESGEGLGTVQVIGYCIMRTALVTQWLRAAREDGSHRTTCRRYALGITIMQLYWIALAVALPGWQGAGLAAFAIGVAGELAVPRVAERAGMTPWHAHHIAERYGLFVIIVLGEGVLGTTEALASAIQSLGWEDGLALVAPASIGLLLGIWWAYFLSPYGERLEERPETCWWWGYGHYFVFASLAALGGGLAIAAESIEHPHEVSTLRAAASIAIPFATFLVAKYLIHARMWARDASHDLLTGAALAILGVAVWAASLGLGLQWVLALMLLAPVLLVGVTEVRERRERAAPAA